MTSLVYDSSRFTYSRSTRLLVVDASDLAFPIGQWPRVVSIRRASGAVVPFHLEDVHRDADNDVQYVRYLSAGIQHELRVYND